MYLRMDCRMVWNLCCVWIYNYMFFSMIDCLKSYVNNFIFICGHIIHIFIMSHSLFLLLKNIHFHHTFCKVYLTSIAHHILWSSSLCIIMWNFWIMKWVGGKDKILLFQGAETYCSIYQQSVMWCFFYKQASLLYTLWFSSSRVLIDSLIHHYVGD